MLARKLMKAGATATIKTYATLDPTYTSSTAFMLSNGNLTVTKVANTGAWDTLFCSTGKLLSGGGQWYFEVQIDQQVGANERLLGLSSFRQPNGLTNYLGYSSFHLGLHLNSSGQSAVYYCNGVGVGSVTSPSPVTGDVFGMLIDLDAKIMWTRLNGGAFFKSATFLLSSIYDSANSPLFPAFSNLLVGSKHTFNFGASPFAYSVPIGAHAGWYTEA